MNLHIYFLLTLYNFTEMAFGCSFSLGSPWSIDNGSLDIPEFDLLHARNSSKRTKCIILKMNQATHQLQKQLDLSSFNSVQNLHSLVG